MVRYAGEPACTNARPGKARRCSNANSCSVAARIDVSPHPDLKIEGHFMDGTGLPKLTRGIYPMDNPKVIKPETNLLVVRLGFNI